MAIKCFRVHIVRALGICAAIALPEQAAASTKTYVPSEDIVGTARICVERYEDNGALNTWPLHIIFGNQIEAIVGGGRAMCVYALSGTYKVSIDWKNSHGDKEAGGSQTVSISDGQMVPLLICNTHTGPADGREWASGWIILRKGGRETSRCR